MTSHYLLPVLALIYAASLYLPPLYITAGPYSSSNRAFDWSDGVDPFHILSYADVHLTHVYPDRTSLVIDYMQKALNYTNPPAFVIAGDIIDGSGSTNPLSFHKQYPGNWEEWEKVAQNVELEGDGRTFVSSAGNHDMFVIASDTEDKNPYRRYFLNTTDAFGVQAFTIDAFPKKIRIINVNPQRPPSTSGPLGMYPHIPDDDLKMIEELIDPTMHNVLASHFPYQNLWNNNGMDEILQRADVLITGHIHPAQSTHGNYGSLLTLVIPALKDTPDTTIVTFDHGQVSMNDLDPTQDHNIIITYPIAKKQITDRTVFNEETFPIRILQFSPDPVFVHAIVDNVDLGPMYYSRTVRPNVHLFELEVTVQPGTHSLTIGGQQIEFFVGQSVPEHKWSLAPKKSVKLLSITVYSVVIYIGIRLLPWWLVFKDSMFEDFIAGETSWGLNMILGPLWLISRFRFVPGSIYGYLIFMYLFALIIPLYFPKMADITVYVFGWGYVGNGVHNSDYMLFFIDAVYLALVVLAFIGISGNLNEAAEKSLSYSIENIVMIIFAAIGTIGWCVIAYLTGGCYTIFTAPLTYIIIGGFLIVFIVSKKNRRQQDKRQYVPVQVISYE